jgi:hypothetical protein
MKRSYIVRGSHGDITVDRLTGVVISRTGCTCPDCHNGYSNIVRFDPVDIAREGGDETDILALGYWTDDDTYVEPLVMKLFSGPFMCRGKVFHADNDFFDWVPLRLLPAPQGI